MKDAKDLAETQGETPPQQIAVHGGDDGTTASHAVRLALESCSDLTEHRAAELFTIAHGAALRYDHGKGRWYRWAGDRWRRDGVRLAFEFARRMVASMTSIQEKGKRTAERAGFSAGVERFAQSDPVHAVEADYFDQEPNLLGVPGATVHLEGEDGWSIADAKPEHRISRQTAITPDSSGSWPGKLHDPTPPGCPRWLRFLDDCTGGDQELIKFLQRFMGYSLTGLTSEHTLIYVHGAGANGKSTLLDCWSGILGEYAQTSSMDVFTAARGERHLTDVAALDGPRLVTASETEAGRPWAEALLKALTGGDTIRARFMRQDSFEFKPKFKLAISGNHLPVLRDTSEAMRRRLRVIPFVHEVPAEKRDPLLPAKLRAEWPAILTWMLDGYLDWARHGLGSAAVIEEATDSYFNESNLVELWIADRCQLRPRSNMRTPAAGLFASWKEWARLQGHEPGNTTTFGRALKKHPGLLKVKLGGGRVAWQGIVLNADQHASDPDQGYPVG